MKFLHKKHWLGFLMINFCFFALCGCGVHKTESVNYTSYPIQVVDDLTGKPIEGAKINALCAGGTPFATNIYTSDSLGIARVQYWANMSGMPLRIRKEGYGTNCFFAKDVVRLKPILL